jgi:hypothetical protein
VAELVERGPTMEEVIEALRHPGPLLEHPVLKAHQARRQAQEARARQDRRSRLTLIEGGEDA